MHAKVGGYVDGWLDNTISLYIYLSPLNVGSTRGSLWKWEDWILQIVDAGILFLVWGWGVRVIRAWGVGGENGNGGFLGGFL